MLSAAPKVIRVCHNRQKLSIVIFHPYLQVICRHPHELSFDPRNMKPLSLVLFAMSTVFV